MSGGSILAGLAAVAVVLGAVLGVQAASQWLDGRALARRAADWAALGFQEARRARRKASHAAALSFAIRLEALGREHPELLAAHVNEQIARTLDYLRRARQPTTVRRDPPILAAGVVPAKPQPHHRTGAMPSGETVMWDDDDPTQPGVVLGR